MILKSQLMVLLVYADDKKGRRHEKIKINLDKLGACCYKIF